MNFLLLHGNCEYTYESTVLLDIRLHLLGSASGFSACGPMSHHVRSQILHSFSLDICIRFCVSICWLGSWPVRGVGDKSARQNIDLKLYYWQEPEEMKCGAQQSCSAHKTAQDSFGAHSTVCTCVANSMQCLHSDDESVCSYSLKACIVPPTSEICITAEFWISKACGFKSFLMSTLKHSNENNNQERTASIIEMKFEC
jgi:hypothetical protein